MPAGLVGSSKVLECEDDTMLREVGVGIDDYS